MIESASVWTHRPSSRSTWVLAEVVADGIHGVGELSDGGPLDELLAAAESVRTSLVGRSVAQARTELGRPADSFLSSTVRGGFAAAVADLTARLEGRSLSESLGLGAPRPVRLYANLNRRFGADGAETIVAEALRAVGNGFTAVKVAPFLDNHARGLTGTRLIDAGLELVTKVRAALPDDVRLMVDCHHLVPAADVVPELAALELHWVEDLVPLGDRAAVESAVAAGLSLAGGEHVWQPAVAAASCGGLAYWLVDPKHAGGPDGVRRIAEAIGETQLTFHNPSGPVGTAHAAQLAGLMGADGWLEYAWGEAAPVGGTLRPEGPGIGPVRRVGEE
ncbi:enolase C-terminal domain-like protein [Kribbella sp. NPDC051137]|uniref:enolase C-terminal domain-like protein n=1 Tax=Kribbella sp. NPDC051137 TaxID=3155045 RepID=UPI002F438F57